MDEVLSLIREWGVYIALPLIVAFITQGLKKKIPFFNTALGLRIVHFIPLVLGVAGGFLLPEETWQSKILIGGGLGSLSIFLYKIVTVSLASKANLENKMLLRNVDVSEEETNQFLKNKATKK